MLRELHCNGLSAVSENYWRFSPVVHQSVACAEGMECAKTGLSSASASVRVSPVLASGDTGVGLPDVLLPLCVVINCVTGACHR